MGASLTSGNVTNLNPATMAFWVRVPETSLAEMVEVESFDTFRCLWDVIPFVTFGPQVTGHADSDASAIFPPSYIGMNTSGGFGSLEVNLICGSGSGNRVWTAPDYYGNAQLDASFESPGFPLLSAGEWHHIMVSWHVIGQSASGFDHPAGTSTMYAFIDGKSKDGRALPAMRTNGDLDPPNSHCSHTINFSGSGGDDGFYNSSGGSIEGSPMCFPVSPSAQVGSTEPSVDSAFHQIQLAEFYLYTRMLTEAAPFIKEGKPRPRSDVFKAIGDPELCMSGSGSWIKGRPKGNAQETPNAEFTPTGEIKVYHPDPEIGK